MRIMWVESLTAVWPPTNWIEQNSHPNLVTQLSCSSHSRLTANSHRLSRVSFDCAHERWTKLGQISCSSHSCLTANSHALWSTLGIFASLRARELSKLSPKSYTNLTPVWPPTLLHSDRLSGISFDCTHESWTNLSSKSGHSTLALFWPGLWHCLVSRNTLFL